MGWFRKSLAFRQTGYAIIVILVIASLTVFAQIFHLLHIEREHLTENTEQQLDLISGAAARAAYFVDDAQAETILRGLFRIKNLAWARISTDLGEILAEQRRDIPTSPADLIARSMFGDISSHLRILDLPEVNKAVGGDEIRNFARTKVGKIELHISPELVGRDFFSDISTFIYVVILQCLLLGAALMVVYHRTVTLPLLRYADELSHVGIANNEQSVLAMPAANKHDELGIIIERTNALLQHIKVQHENLIHREKIATMGTLLAGVAHELNNPLAILAAQSELLVETAESAKTRERGKKIFAMTNRCVAIVRRFLVLARRRKVEREAMNIGDTISDVLEILDHQLGLAGIEISFSASRNLPLVFADSSQITQVLLNLVINAKQALAAVDDGRRIEVDAKFIASEAMVRIVVADNGPGIAADSEARIFQPFYTTKLEGQGTGLGLSYSYDVAHSHGGRLTVEVSRLGGAAFVLMLPVFIADEATEN